VIEHLGNNARDKEMLTRILRNVKGDMFNGRMKGIT
jgi:hypothetical protein